MQWIILSALLWFDLIPFLVQIKQLTRWTQSEFWVLPNIFLTVWNCGDPRLHCRIDPDSPSEVIRFLLKCTFTARISQILMLSQKHLERLARDNSIKLKSCASTHQTREDHDIFSPLYFKSCKCNLNSLFYARPMSAKYANVQFIHL